MSKDQINNKSNILFLLARIEMELSYHEMMTEIIRWISMQTIKWMSSIQCFEIDMCRDGRSTKEVPN